MKRSFLILALSALTLTGCNNKFVTGDFSIVKAGDEVPEFTITDVTGDNEYDSRTEYRPTLIYFFWTGCPECATANGPLMDLWKTIVDDNSVRLVCIARGDDYASQQEALDKWDELAVSVDPSPMPPLFYDRGRAVYNLFASQGVPRFCVVDADGIIRWHQEGAQDEATLRGELNKAKVPLEEEEQE